MKTETIELGGKKLIMTTAPATVGFEVVMRLRSAYSANSAIEIRDCVFMLLKYCELDLGDGRTIKLDNAEIINQHLSIEDIMDLQDRIIRFNFGFLMKGDH